MVKQLYLLIFLFILFLAPFPVYLFSGPRADPAKLRVQILEDIDSIDMDRQKGALRRVMNSRDRSTLEEAYPKLITLTESAKGELRAMAFQALATSSTALQRAEGLKLVRNALHDSDPAVQRGVEFILHRIEGREAKRRAREQQ